MTDRAKPTERKKPTNADWFDSDYCYNYMAALAKRLNLRNVREVPEKLAWYAEKVRHEDSICLPDLTNRAKAETTELLKIKVALTAGEHHD